MRSSEVWGNVHCAIRGTLKGNKAACVSARGGWSLQCSPETHPVTKNCNSESMTPSKSSQTMPKIIEKEWRVISLQPEQDSCVLCSNAWDLMEMGRQPGAKASQYRTARALMLGQIMRKGPGFESMTSKSSCVMNRT